MSRDRLQLLGAALTATLTAACMVAAAPAAPISLELRGALRVDVTEAGRTEVVVPDDTVVSWDDISVEVAHGFAGIILTDLDDDSGFSLQAIRYPATETDGDGHLSRTIELAEEDAAASTYPGGPSQRSCTADCRLPAGTYTLLAITEDGVAASLGLDLGDGAATVTDGELTPIGIAVDDAAPLGGAFDVVQMQSGARVAASFPARGRAFAFQQVDVEATATGAGVVHVEHCHTVGGECTSTRFDVYRPTAAASDGNTGFIETVLAAGEHGTHVGWEVDAVGGGELTIVTDALRVYPD